MLNACQARFLNLQLYVDDGSPDGITLDAALHPTNAAGPAFLVLGTEGGFLPQAVSVPANQPFDSVTFSGSLITAPAERWDLLVDFTGYAGKRVILYNDAPAPFPTPPNQDNDHFPGSPTATTPTPPGSGPDTRQIMAFDVVPARGQDAPSTITAGYDLTPGLDPFLVPPGTSVQAGEVQLPSGVPVRTLTLNEGRDGSWRLLQLLGTDTSTGLDTDGALQFGQRYMDPPTETPAAGTTEVWQILNLTADTHPIHFHLVNVQVLARRRFNPADYRTPTAPGATTGTLTFTDPARGPDPTELGWKETVRMNPAEVTWVIMRFDLPSVPFTVPASPRTGGHEYVWHCHILEHEEHDMMRPLVIP